MAAAAFVVMSASTHALLTACGSCLLFDQLIVIKVTGWFFRRKLLDFYANFSGSINLLPCDTIANLCSEIP